MAIYAAVRDTDPFWTQHRRLALEDLVVSLSPTEEQAVAWRTVPVPME